VIAHEPRTPRLPSQCFHQPSPPAPAPDLPPLPPIEEDNSDVADNGDEAEIMVHEALSYAFTVAAHDLGVSEPCTVSEALRGPQ
jgi:hypothetical protein